MYIQIYKNMQMYKKKNNTFNLILPSSPDIQISKYTNMQIDNYTNIQKYVYKYKFNSGYLILSSSPDIPTQGELFLSQLVFAQQVVELEQI